MRGSARGAARTLRATLDERAASGATARTLREEREAREDLERRLRALEDRFPESAVDKGGG